MLSVVQISCRDLTLLFPVLIFVFSGGASPSELFHCANLDVLAKIAGTPDRKALVLDLEGSTVFVASTLFEIFNAMTGTNGEGPAPHEEPVP